MTEVRSKKKVSSKRRGQFHFATPLDICFETRSWNRNSKKNTEDGLYPEATLWNTILWLLCFFHRAGFVSISNDGRQDHGYHLQIARLQWTGSRRSISLYPCQPWRMLPDFSKFQSQNVQTYGDVFHDKWQKSWSTTEDPVVLLERNLYGHPLAGLLWEGSSVGILDGSKYRIGNVCLFIENNDYSYRFMWMILKWLEESRIWLLCGTNGWNSLIWENQHRFLTMKIWDVLHVNASRTKVLLMNTENVRITNLCQSNWKVTWLEKSHAITIAWSCDMEGHAKKCVKRSCEFANKSVESNCTRSLHHVLMAINSWWCRNYCLNVRRSQAIQRWTGPALMVQWRWRSPREERGMEWSPVVSPLRSVFCVTFCSLHRCNITCHIRQRGCVLIFGFLLKEHVDARRKAK